jgi:hypothetical protein
MPLLGPWGIKILIKIATDSSMFQPKQGLSRKLDNLETIINNVLPMFLELV